MTTFGSKKREKSVGTAAARLARNVDHEILGSQWLETDTGNVYEVATTAGADYPALLLHQWVLLGGAGGGGWGKYVVSPDADINAPYTTIQSAIDAAVTAGHTSANPAHVLVHPDTYVEDLTLHVGVHVVAFNGGAQNAPAMVTVTGAATVANVAGTLLLAGLNLATSTGSPLTLGGTAAVALRLQRCQLSTTDELGHALSVTNSDGGTSVAFDDCALSALGATAMTSARAVSAYRTSFTVPSSDRALSLGIGTDDAFVDCRVTGSILKESGACVLERCTLDAATPPALSGSAAWDCRDVTAPSGLGMQNGTTQTVVRTWRQHTLTDITGPGPVAVTTEMGDTITIEPDGEEFEIDLPDVTTVLDGAEYTFLMNGTGIGSNVVILTAATAQFIGVDLLNWYRLHESGTVTLRADVTNLRWEIAAERVGVPQDLVLTVDATGDDNNPGTVARPLRTIRKALDLANRYQYYASGTANVTSAGTESANDWLVPGGTRTNSTAFQVIGSVFAVTAGFAASYTTNGAGAAFASGPPVTLARAAIAVTGAFAADAAVGSYIRFASGALSGSRLPVGASTTTTVDFTLGTPAPGVGVVFVIEQPAWVVNDGGFGATLGLRPGTGKAIVFTGIRVTTQRNVADVVVKDDTCVVAVTALTRAIMIAGAASGVGGTAFDPAYRQVAISGSTHPSVFGSVIGDGASALLAQNGALVVASGNSWRGQYFFTSCSLNGTITYAGEALELTTCVGHNFVVNASQGRGIVLNNVTFTNASPASPALTFDNGTLAKLTNVRGTTPAGQPGVSALHFSHVNVTDPSTGTTISDGAGTEVTVGVLGNKTWATLNANAFANINDNSGSPAGGTGVTVSK